ncbi:hypothetical protein Goari_002722 [Gossypium aridum]|uniref:Uncharacterized protein n=1 Tax=Gossypium aridum TaxID=34290 RepID=A0A7J8YAW4_GOSAI|nr:hypothetical protein [Gossypium aridum]
MGDATPIEGFNDSNKHDTENEDIHNLENLVASMCEYEEQIGNARFSSLLATSSYDFQYFQPPPSSQGP